MSEQKRGKNKGKMGRPKKEIDYEQVERLASVGCTIKEISAIMQISEAVLYADAHFSEFHKRGLENLRMSLRRQQVKKAIDENNTTMQIWLGKQLLGQSEEPDSRLAEIEYKKAITALTKKRTELLEAAEGDMSLMQALLDAAQGKKE